MLVISRPVVTSNVGSGISAVIGRVTDGFLSVQQTISLRKGSLFGEKIAREGKEGGEGGERERERERPFHFSLSPVPRSTKGLFTG